MATSYFSMTWKEEKAFYFGLLGLVGVALILYPQCWLAFEALTRQLDKGLEVSLPVAIFFFQFSIAIIASPVFLVLRLTTYWL
jgi:hypothetical protein